MKIFCPSSNSFYTIFICIQYNNVIFRCSAYGISYKTIYFFQTRPDEVELIFCTSFNFGINLDNVIKTRIKVMNVRSGNLGRSTTHDIQMYSFQNSSIFLLFRRVQCRNATNLKRSLNYIERFRKPHLINVTHLYILN